MLNEERASYWQRYYREGEAPTLPSQFAVFVLGELKTDLIIDVGCGSGRDTFFFGSRGIRSIGVDGSQAAVDACRSANRRTDVIFVCADASSDTLLSALKNQIGSPAFVTIYARFFVHAIQDAEEETFLSNCRDLLSGHQGCLAVEFRTSRDRSLTKVTPDHYRRFVDPAMFIARASGLGFHVNYHAEGFGFAKYREDDAHVARMILSLRS